MLQLPPFQEIFRLLKPAQVIHSQKGRFGSTREHTSTGMFERLVFRSNLDTVTGTPSVGMNLGETHIEIVLVISHTIITWRIIPGRTDTWLIAMVK